MMIALWAIFAAVLLLAAITAVDFLWRFNDSNLGHETDAEIHGNGRRTSDWDWPVLGDSEPVE